MTRLGKPLLVGLWVSLSAHAQQAQEADQEAAQEAAQVAPPLVTVEDADAPHEAVPVPPQPPSAEGGVLQPRAIANPPIEAPQATTREEPPGRALRVAMGVLFGAVAGASGAIAGTVIGATALPDAALQPLGAAGTGSAIGFALLAPLGVLLSGWLFDVDGSVWATLLGDLVGAGAGALAVWLGGSAGAPLLYGLPLAGSVLGYEVTSPAAKSLVKVSASVMPLRDGALLGVAGAF